MGTQHTQGGRIGEKGNGKIISLIWEQSTWCANQQPYLSLQSCAPGGSNPLMYCTHVLPQHPIPQMLFPSVYDSCCAVLCGAGKDLTTVGAVVDSSAPS